MSIYDHFYHLNLTNHQQFALKKLQAFLNSDERLFILQGYAGSGKTTLMKGLVDYIISLNRKFKLMAPTGRAAKVINQKTGLEASTIHKGIYSFDELIEIKEGGNESDVSFLYQFKICNNSDAHNTVFVIDEASMISDIVSQGEFFRFGSGCLLKDIISFSRVQQTSTTSKIIFIGDPAQLPPVGMNFSPALESKYFLETYNISVSFAEMKEVIRQDESNGILQAATKIRKCLSAGYFNDFDLRANNQDIFNPPFHDFLKTYKSLHDQKIIICFKNKTALDINIAIRNDKFGNDLPIQPSDTVIIGNNNYHHGIMNGEFAVVTDADSSVITRNIHFYNKGGKTQVVNLVWRRISLLLPDEGDIPKNVSGYMLENFLCGDNSLSPDEQIALYVDFKNRNPNLKEKSDEFKSAISMDPFFNCILLKYGYAVTCHKAQGGEWDNAIIFWDRGISSNFNFYESEHTRAGKTNSDFFKWAYTAITRASKRIFCINPPFFSSFSGMNFIDTNVQKAFNELTGSKNTTVEINIKDVMPDLEKFGLTNAPLSIQDHFIHKWYHLRKQYIDIVAWQHVGYEIRYIFERVNQKAAFKFWINAKNIFKESYQNLPALTNSDDLFNTISKIIDGSHPISVIRNNVDGILTQIEFDYQIEEEKPFLKNLYDQILTGLGNDAVISDIQHFAYRERYTVESNDGVCVFDFEYDGVGFLGRVLPIENRCNSIKIMSKMKEIVNKLKAADYVI